MRKYFAFAALVLAAAVSCTKETATDEVNVPRPGYVEVTLTANTDAATKASLDGKKVVWEVGEKVAVFPYNTGDAEEFTVTSVDGTTVKISGTLPENASDYFYAAYPFKNAVQVKESMVDFVIPEQSVQADESVDPNALLSLAVFEDANDVASFQNIGALLKFTVGEEGVTSVKFTAEDSGALGGTIGIVCKKGDIPRVATAATESSVTVNCDEGFTKDAVYYAVVAPGEYSGFSATSIASGKTKVRSTTKAGEIERNAVLDLGDITEGAVASRLMEITNAAELEAFLTDAASYTAEDVVKIANDIDCSGVTLTQADSFAGTLDGQDYRIKNLSTTQPMFKAVQGVLKNIVFDESCVYTPGTNGRMGFLTGGVSKGGKVLDCINYADITFTKDMTLKGNTKFGSLIGYVAGYASGCKNYGNITIDLKTGTNKKLYYFGGVIGSFAGTAGEVLIEDCHNYGDITFSWSGTPRYPFVGGVVGTTDAVDAKNGQDITETQSEWKNQGKIQNCSNSGSIKAVMKTLKTGAYFNVGGVIGYLEGDIDGCTNSGTVSIDDAVLETDTDYATRPAVGGVAGYVMYSATNCINEKDGAVTLNGTFTAGTSGNAAAGGTHQPIIGGVFGGVGTDAYNSSLPLTNCTNNADVKINTLQKKSAKSQFYGGGVVGYCAVDIDGCNNYGKVDAKAGQKVTRVGGIVGNLIADNISNCTNKGNVTQDVDGRDNASTSYAYQNYVAGIVAYITGSDAGKASIANCTNAGIVTLKNAVSSGVYHYAGGILGQYESALKSIVSCSNSGNVSTSAYAGSEIKARVGGIAAAANASEGVSDSENTGNVALEGGATDSQIGGFAGYWGNGSTSKCSSSGSVTSNSAAATYVGGFAGALNVDAEWTDLGVDATVTASEGEYAGAIIGGFSGAEKTLTLAGDYDTDATVNGAAISADNLAGYLNDGAIVGWEAPKVLQLEKVWGHYGTAGVAGWPAYVSGVEDLDGNIRNATMDDEFVYIPKTAAVKDASGENFTEYKIFKFSTTDGSYQGLVTPQTDPGYMKGTWASTFPVSCARVMKNTDPTINGGKDVLVCTNLCNGQNVRLYAWEDGIDKQPRLLTNFSSARRFGDRISVEGTYKEGRVWYRSYAAGTTAFINLAPGYTSGFNGSHAWNWVEGIGATATDDGDAMTEFTSFNKGAYGILSSNSGKGIYLLNGNATEKVYSSYKRCFGWQSFSFNGEDYIAYLDMSGGTNLPIVKVIKGSSDSLSNLQATLDDKNVVLEASIAVEDQNDLTTEGVYATNNQGDCVVRNIGEDTYILGATRGGIALFKMVLK